MYISLHAKALDCLRIVSCQTHKDHKTDPADEKMHPGDRHKERKNEADHTHSDQANKAHRQNTPHRGEVVFSEDAVERRRSKNAGSCRKSGPDHLPTVGVSKSRKHRPK